MSSRGASAIACKGKSARPRTARASSVAEDRLAHRRSVVDEQRAVELAALRGGVGRRAQLRQRAVGRGHARVADTAERYLRHPLEAIQDGFLVGFSVVGWHQGCFPLPYELSSTIWAEGSRMNN